MAQDILWTHQCKRERDHRIKAIGNFTASKWNAITTPMVRILYNVILCFLFIERFCSWDVLTIEPFHDNSVQNVWNCSFDSFSLSWNKFISRQFSTWRLLIASIVIPTRYYLSMYSWKRVFVSILFEHLKHNISLVGTSFHVAYLVLWANIWPTLVSRFGFAIVFVYFSPVEQCLKIFDNFMGAQHPLLLIRRKCKVLSCNIKYSI